MNNFSELQPVSAVATIGDSTVPVDPAVLVELSALLGSEFTSLLVTFLDEAPQLLAGAAAAQEAGDFPAVASSAHSLKSSSANLGATKLAEMARTLEDAALRDNASKLGTQLTAMQQEFRRVDLVLRQHVKTGRNDVLPTA